MKHDRQKILSLGDGVMPAEPEGLPLYKFGARRRDVHEAYCPVNRQKRLTYSKRYELETTSVPGKPNV